MKIAINELFIKALAVIVLFGSCNSNELNKKAESTGVNFYTELKNKNYNAALNFCSDKAFDKSSKQDWTTALIRNAVLLGDLQSYTKTSDFNIATSTNVGTTVTLAYDVKWQFGNSIDSMVLIKDNDGNMKIFRYAWNYKDAKFISEVKESEKLTSDYMAAVKAGNINAVTALLSAEALKITPQNKWAAFLNNANNKLGNITDYQIIADSSTYNIGSTGGVGKGNYYDVFVLSSRGNNKIMEKLIFFQKNYNEPVQIISHDFL